MENLLNDIYNSQAFNILFGTSGIVGSLAAVIGLFKRSKSNSINNNYDEAMSYKKYLVTAVVMFIVFLCFLTIFIVYSSSSNNRVTNVIREAVGIYEVKNSDDEYNEIATAFLLKQDKDIYIVTSFAALDNNSDDLITDFRIVFEEFTLTPPDLMVVAYSLPYDVVVMQPQKTLIPKSNKMLSLAEKSEVSNDTEVVVVGVIGDGKSILTASLSNYDNINSITGYSQPIYNVTAKNNIFGSAVISNSSTNVVGIVSTTSSNNNMFFSTPVQYIKELIDNKEQFISFPALEFNSKCLFYSSHTNNSYNYGEKHDLNFDGVEFFKSSSRTFLDIQTVDQDIFESIYIDDVDDIRLLRDEDINIGLKHQKDDGIYVFGRTYSDNSRVYFDKKQTSINFDGEYLYLYIDSINKYNYPWYNNDYKTLGKYINNEHSKFITVDSTHVSYYIQNNNNEFDAVYTFYLSGECWLTPYQDGIAQESYLTKNLPENCNIVIDSQDKLFIEFNDSEITASIDSLNNLKIYDKNYEATYNPSLNKAELFAYENNKLLAHTSMKDNNIITASIESVSDYIASIDLENYTMSLVFEGNNTKYATFYKNGSMLIKDSQQNKTAYFDSSDNSLYIGHFTPSNNLDAVYQGRGILFDYPNTFIADFSGSKDNRTILPYALSIY
jgi:hypothetical protein